MASKNENFGNFPSAHLKPESDVESAFSQETQPKVTPSASPASAAQQNHSSDVTRSQFSGGTTSSSSATDNGDVASDVKSKADELSRNVKAKAEQLRTEVETKVAQAKQEGQRIMDDARERGAAEIEGSKHLVADEVGGFANALQATVNQLNSQNQTQTAHYVNQAASSLERIAQNLRDQDLGSLLHQVEDFARRKPELFLGGAVVGGFLLARFLKSSAARRQYSASYATTSQPKYSSTWQTRYDRASSYTTNTPFDSVATVDSASASSAASDPNSALNANTSAVEVSDPQKS